VIPWELIDSTEVPGGGDMTLHRRGSEFVIRVNGEELMSSRRHGSEEVLAELGCAGLSGKKEPRVLIGGLGMGFTLAEALTRLPAGAQVVVAELVPAVIEWNKGPLADLSGHAMDDRRVSIRCGDATGIIREEKGSFDAILLDVDNGPAGLTRDSNNWLYSASGLAAACSALRPGGIAAVWSAGPDDRFTARMSGAGFRVEQVKVKARRHKGSRHIIWVGQKR
jgi:spermidine synthase